MQGEEDEISDLEIIIPLWDKCGIMSLHSFKSCLTMPQKPTLLLSA